MAYRNEERTNKKNQQCWVNREKRDWRPTNTHTYSTHTFSRGTFPRSCENLIKGDLTLLGGCVCGRVWESRGICKGQHKRRDDWKREKWREHPEREAWHGTAWGEQVWEGEGADDTREFSINIFSKEVHNSVVLIVCFGHGWHFKHVFVWLFKGLVTHYYITKNSQIQCIGDLGVTLLISLSSFMAFEVK